MNHFQNNNKKIILFAYDQGLELGPSVFDPWSQDVNNIFELVSRHPFDGIILQKGLAEIYSQKFKLNKLLSYKVPNLIVKVNGKTSLYEDNDRSMINCSLDYALELGAKGIGYTLYLGSKFESKMISEASKVQEYCRSNQIPFILWAYPKIHKKPDLNLSPDVVSYSARVALELGADYAKLKFPKFDIKMSREDKVNYFRNITKIANDTQVLFQGGKQIEEDDFIENCTILKDSEIAGMAVGRNLWQSKTPDDIINKVFKIWGVDDPVEE